MFNIEALFNFIANAWNFLWPIFIAIVLFGIIIFIHEFGHFIFAKLFKVKVNEFALGFGPTILKFQKGETKYALRIFPIGGFCAMEGEDSGSDDERSINKKPVWQRFIIIAAGAVFNLILGLILIISMVTMQPAIASTQVSKFHENANSSKTGLQIGDKIVKINGRTVLCNDDLGYMFLLASDKKNNDKVDMTVIRDKKKVTIDNVQLALSDQVVNGRRYIVNDFYVSPVKKTIPSVIHQGFLKTCSMARLVWMTLGDLITGKFGLNDMSGPVGITGAVSDAVKDVAAPAAEQKGGLWGLLFIMSMITVNLGVFNLLPIPALDGGRLFFLLIEGIRRKPIDPKKEGIIHAAGFAILIVFIIIVSGNDIWKLFTGKV